MTTQQALDTINGAEIMSLNVPIRKLQSAVLALRVFLQELTGCDGDLIDMTHTLNKLVFQYLIENGAEATE